MSVTQVPLPGLYKSLVGSVSTLYEAVIPYFEVNPDVRVSEWPLMSSPYPTFVLAALYLLVVWAGPKYMANREAFSLNNVLIIYNFMLVILSAYMLHEFVATTLANPDFSLACSSIDRSDNALALRLAKVCWWYYFSKPIEFLDTIFFILRKKDNQVSFLHVYHHVSMPLLWWVGARYLPGGPSYFSAMLNSGVHVLMYTYYMFAAVGPHMRKYLWWKRYMTAIQLGQFWMILCHTLYEVYTNCGHPRGYGVALVLYMVSHILLFTNFYNKAYNASAQTLRSLSPRGKNSERPITQHDGKHRKVD